MQLSITGRITLLWTVLFAVGLSAFALAAAALVEHEGREALDSDLATRAQEALNAVRRRQSVSLVGDSGVVVLRRTQTVMASGVPLPRALGAMSMGSFAHGATVDRYRVVELTNTPYRAVAFTSDATLVAEAERIRTGFLLAALPVLGYEVTAIAARIHALIGRAAVNIC